jgi:non-lysosomal glucosylceramidase
MTATLGTSQTSQTDRRSVSLRHGESLRHVAMPLGGVGAGHVAIGGDGGLRQWQLHNRPNHRGFIPDSFFAVRVTSTEPPRNVIRLLQSREVADLPLDPTPLVTDDEIPQDQRDLVDLFSGVQRTTFSATYPTARIAYLDDELPLAIELEAFTPFIPLDEWASGLPAALFTFTLHNPTDMELHGALAATLQNAVGWDGVTPIAGNRNPLYGGNVNRVRRATDRTSLVMENLSLPPDHPGAGQMVLTAVSPNVRAYEQWTEPGQFLRFMEGLNAHRQFEGQDSTRQSAYQNQPVIQHGPSPAGTTWNGGLMVPFWIMPGETIALTFAMSWYFPNRFVNFDQFGPMRDYGHSRFWLGNAYSSRFASATEVVDHILANRRDLEDTTRAWEALFTGSTLPDVLAEAISAQASLVRSPTTFWTEDGNFFGFEGALGASTTMWNGDFGGSCPLNCSHVWNYEMALSRLFPRLERRMRATELEVVQAPEGYIPHRTILPLYLRQLWGEPIGGPTRPALDGMLGAILKTYREVRQDADLEWLRVHWDHLQRLLRYIRETWDDNGDGVLEGEQGNTYDIHFFGPNIYIGGLWLAALRAAEEMARLLGEEDQVAEFRALFERGSARYDDLLWNGEYYIQLLDDAAPHADQFGDGCLSDQLFGQWWAHLLDLGYILPQEHVRTTLGSIARYNTRRGFSDFEHGFRVFADRSDSGLLVCTWPRGGRPAIPVRYCDEVWTGIEYQVAALSIMEGLIEQGLSMLTDLRARYAGDRRNPYNEIECGDHYSRAMAGWSVLEAWSGLRFDSARNQLRLVHSPGREGSRLPFVTASGWGELRQERKDDGDFEVTFDVRYGVLAIGSLVLVDLAGSVTAGIDGADVSVSVGNETGETALTFPVDTTVSAGSSLTVRLHPDQPTA